MGKLEIAGKGTLFTVSISLVTAGSQLISQNFYAGLALLIIGVALIVVWSYLIDKEARAEARKAALEAFEKLQMERKMHG